MRRNNASGRKREHGHGSILFLSVIHAKQEPRGFAIEPFGER
jgi:hypothetical protein